MIKASDQVVDMRGGRWTIHLAAAAASGQGKALGDEREVVHYSSTDKNRTQLLLVIYGECSQEHLCLPSLSAAPSQPGQAARHCIVLGKG